MSKKRKKGMSITPELCASCKVLVDAGLSKAAIARALNISTATLYHIREANYDFDKYREITSKLWEKRRLAQEAKKSVVPKFATVVTQDMCDRAKTLASEGMHYVKVAKELGVSDTTSWYIMKGDYDFEKYRVVRDGANRKVTRKPSVEIQRTKSDTDIVLGRLNDVLDSLARVEALLKPRPARGLFRGHGNKKQ